MPTISLRLTDAEHAALKEWAHGSRRSMQREAVYRIFAGGAMVTGERRTASGSTAVTAPASPADKAEASEMTKEVQGTPPLSLDDGALRPPRFCPMNPPRGTKCKVCGKVHPL